MIETRTIQTAPERTFTADVAGAPDAELVVLLHGFPQTRFVWRHQLPALADAGYRAVAPDQRGYSPGARPKGVDAYRTSALVEDLFELVDALEVDRFHLVGHDWGGALAWLAAARTPERIHTLTVVSRPHPAAFAASFAADAAQAERSKHHKSFHDPKTADRLLADDARRLRALFANAAVEAEDAQTYIDVLGERAALDAALDWYRAAGSREDGLARMRLAAIRMPTLYLWGTADETVGRVAAEATAEHVEGPYTFVELPDLGHFCMDQAVDEINAPLLRHLAAYGT